MASDEAPDRPVKCPICGKPAVERYQPFCSKRCADIDLGRWFSGGYQVAGSHREDADDEVRLDNSNDDEEGPAGR